MKNNRVFLSENFQFLEVEYSIHFNRRVFIMSLNYHYGLFHSYPTAMINPSWLELLMSRTHFDGLKDQPIQDVFKKMCHRDICEPGHDLTVRVQLMG